MNHKPSTILPCLLALALCFGLAVSAEAEIVLGWAETWAVTDDIEGWEYDGGVNALSWQDDGAGDDGTGYLRVDMGTTAFYGTFEEGRAYADSGASGDGFTGNYAVENVQGVTFNFLAEDYLPSYVDIHFTSSSGRTWMYYLPNPSAIGVWESYGAEFDYNAGWTLGNPETNASESTWFLADLSNVTWIGVNIARNPSDNQQFYGIDNFSLVIPEPGEWAMLAAVAAAFLLYMRFYGVGLAAVPVLSTPVSELLSRRRRA